MRKLVLITVIFDALQSIDAAGFYLAQAEVMPGKTPVFRPDFSSQAYQVRAQGDTVAWWNYLTRLYGLLPKEDLDSRCLVPL